VQLRIPIIGVLISTVEFGGGGILRGDQYSSSYGACRTGVKSEGIKDIIGREGVIGGCIVESRKKGSKVKEYWEW
jgi:hypothetical protein